MKSRPFVVKAANARNGNRRLLAFLCPDAPPDALAKSQRFNNWCVRAAITLNSNTPDNILVCLSQEGNAVVQSLAKHVLVDRQSRKQD